MWFLRLKLYYIFLFFGHGAISNYLTLFYRSTGMNAVQVGTLSAIWPIASFLVLPLFSYLADRYHCHRTILFLCSLISSSVASGLLVYSNTRVVFQGLLVFVCCFTVFYAPLMNVLDTIVLEKLSQTKREKRIEKCLDPSLENLDKKSSVIRESQESCFSYGRQRAFGSLSFGIGGCVVAFLMNQEALHSASSAQSWCNNSIEGCNFVHKLFLSTEVTEKETTTNGVGIIFYGYILAVGILFTLTLVWPSAKTFRAWFQSWRAPVSDSSKQMKSVQVDLEKSNQISLTRCTSEVDLRETGSRNDLLEDPISTKTISLFQAIYEIIRFDSQAGHALQFWLFVLLQGFTQSIINNYLIFMLVDRLHAPTSVIGLSNIMRVTLEIPFFYFSSQFKWVVSRVIRALCKDQSLHSHVNALRWTMALSSLILALRCSFYAFMSYFEWPPHVDLCIELLHGIIYATFYSSAVQLASLLAPVYLQTTSQGLFGAIFVGLGSTLGSFSGGVLYGLIGHTLLYSSLCLANICSVLAQTLAILNDQKRFRTMSERVNSF